MGPTDHVENLSLPRLRWVDAICDRFESAWLAGQRPDPEAFAADAPPADRNALLLALIALDAECRRRAGENPTPEDYFARFPDLDPSAVSAAVNGPEPTDASTLRTDPDHSPDGPGPLVPGYEVLGELGRGAMGVVYRARHLRLNRAVALKMVRGHERADPRELIRFLAEAEAVAAVRHPHVVQVYDYGEAGGRPFMALEFLAGGPLTGKLKAAGRLAPGDAAALVAKVARGVAAAHEQYIVHRDLKPANVLLDERGEPKVADFGLAKRATNQDLTQSGAVVGTPAYMAPEQARGEGKFVGPPADVWALGVILYEALTGSRPFAAETAHGLIRKIIDEEAVPPRHLEAGLPRDLERICLHCLEKEPRDRYSSATDLADDLERFVRGEPVSVRAAGGLERFGRWCRRNPVLAAVSGVAALALVAVAVVSSAFGVTQYQTAEQLRTALERAAEARDRAADRAAALSLERGLGLCDQGYVGHGTLLMAGGLAAAPDNSTDLRRVLRHQISAWADRVNPLQSCLPHDQTVSKGRFSPDGRTFATATNDGTVRLWDLQTGEELWKTPALYPAAVIALNFSPDGTHLAAALSDGTVRQWDAATGRPRGAPLQHLCQVHAVAFRHDGLVLAAAGGNGLIWNGEVSLWDPATGKQLARLQFSQSLYAVAFSPDGRWLVAAGKGGVLGLWDAADPAKPRDASPRVAGPEGKEWWGGLKFSPDGRALVVAHAERVCVCRFDPNQQVVLKAEATLAARERANTLEFEPDGKAVLVGLELGRGEGALGRYDVTSGQPLGPALQNQGPVHVIGIDPDGRTVRLAGLGTAARIWKVAPASPPCRVLRHPHPVAFAAFGEDGRSVLTACSPPDDGWGEVRMWDGGTLAPVWSKEAHRGTMGAALSPDGRTLATGGLDKKARLWDAKTGQPLGEPIAHGHVVYGLALSPDAKTLATTSENSQARLWDVATGRPARDKPLFHDRRPAYGVAFSPDGRTLATGCLDGVARLWDWGQPADKPRLTLRHEASVTKVAFSPDGRLLLTGCADNTARFWDAATGEPVLTALPHRGEVGALAFSRDGRTVATAAFMKADGRGEVRLWDVATGRPLGPPLDHPKAVSSVAFSPDGRTLLTGCGDQAARLWPLAAPTTEGPERVTLRLQALTGLELDENGGVQALDAATWRQRRDRLLAAE